MSVWDKDPGMTDLLRDLVRRNMTASEIGGILKITRNAVIGRANRLGMSITGGHQSRGVVGRARKGPGKAVADVPMRNRFQEPSPPRKWSWEAAE